MLVLKLLFFKNYYNMMMGKVSLNNFLANVVPNLG